MTSRLGHYFIPKLSLRVAHKKRNKVIFLVLKLLFFLWSYSISIDILRLWLNVVGWSYGRRRQRSHTHNVFFSSTAIFIPSLLVLSRSQRLAASRTFHTLFYCRDKNSRLQLVGIGKPRGHQTTIQEYLYCVCACVCVWQCVQLPGRPLPDAHVGSETHD